MATLKKTILKTGEYVSPDGKISITPGRLKHWQATHQQMRANRQVVPISWDHGNSIEQLSALSDEQYKTRSAQSTIGKMVDFVLGSDGQSAELTVEITDPTAEGRATRNEVFVSPVILPSWRDGAGNEYSDCITHVDLVNHPVDHSQTSFTPVAVDAIACGLRMGLSQVYRMATKPDDEMDDTEDMGAEAESEGESPETEAVEQQPGPPSKILSDVLAALSGMKIVLPPDTNESNFLDRLHSALLTAAAHRADDNKPDQVDPNATPNANDSATAPVAQQPDISTMSALPPAVQAKLAWAEKQHKSGIAKRLSALLKSGRCTPEEATARKPLVDTVRLSLDENGNGATSKIEEFLDAREGIPAGTFWDAETKTRRMSVADHPESVRGEMPKQKVDETVNYAFGRN